MQSGHGSPRQPTAATADDAACHWLSPTLLSPVVAMRCCSISAVSHSRPVARTTPAASCFVWDSSLTGWLGGRISAFGLVRYGCWVPCCVQPAYPLCITLPTVFEFRAHGRRQRRLAWGKLMLPLCYVVYTHNATATCLPTNLPNYPPTTVVSPVPSACSPLETRRRPPRASRRQR